MKTCVRKKVESPKKMSEFRQVMFEGSKLPGEKVSLEISQNMNKF